MSFLDGASLDPQTTPWAPKVPLAPAPDTPPAPAQKPVVAAMQSQAPDAKAARITPETHPHFFEAPKAASGNDYFATVRKRESGGNDLAWNGVAAGRYQFTPQTWLGVAAAHPELGLKPEDIWNGEKQEAAMRAHTADNTRVLESQGLKATPGNLYMLHFLGAGGGPAFLKAVEVDPALSGASLFPKEAKYNPTIFFDQSGRPRNLGQIYGLMTKDFGGAAAPSAAPEPTETALAPPSATPLIEGRAADESPELPPLPPGAKPITDAQDIAVPEIPPLPPGAKPITTEDAYQQDLGKGPYEAEAEKSKNAPPAGLVKQFGEAKAREMWKDPLVRSSIAVSNATEGALPGGEVGSEFGNVVGAVQMPFGLAENVPGPVGQGASEVNHALNQVGDPAAREQGTIAAQMVPLAKGAAAVKAGATTALEGGGGFANWVKSLASGARGGGVAAASNPTGETDPDKRVKEKMGDVAERTVEGAAIGGAVPAVAGAAKWISKEAASAWGKTVEKAKEELRTGVNAETGKVLTEAERAAREADVQAGTEKLKAAMHEAEAARIEKARQQTEDSAKVRAEKGRDTAAADDPEAAARLKVQVAARMRDRVRDAERVARETTEAEAKAKAAHAETEVKAPAAEQEAKQRAEAARQSVIDKHAEGKTAAPEDVGADLHKTAVEDMKALKDERSEKSGFDKAVKSDGGVPSVPTGQFIEEASELWPNDRQRRR
jgi:hypothetical protein